MKLFDKYVWMEFCGSEDICLLRRRPLCTPWQHAIMVACAMTTNASALLAGEDARAQEG